MADGVHRITHAHVDCYLVEDEDGVTPVDAGLPSMWPTVLAGHTDGHGVLDLPGRPGEEASGAGREGDPGPRRKRDPGGPGRRVTSR